jgi:hypothetical protein
MPDRDPADHRLQNGLLPTKVKIAILATLIVLLGITTLIHLWLRHGQQSVG